MRVVLTLRRVIIGSIATLILLLVAAGAGWWFLVREDNDLATSAPAIPSDLVEPTQTEGATGAESLTFRIVPERSEAAYFAGEQLARLPVPSTAKGATNDIEGEFHLTADGFDLDGTEESKFTVNLSTLKSDEDRRDNRVQDALETSRFPTATFVIRDVTAVDSTLPPTEEHTFRLTGVLDLHGVQKVTEWEVRARRDGNVMTALATTTFRFDEFNITPPNIAGFVSVVGDITLQVQVVAEALS